MSTALRRKRLRWLTAAVFVILAVAVLGVLCLQSVCRDWAYICENSGSRRGHRQWFFGRTTGQWSRQSRLEEFMRSKFPTEFHNRWTSYAGTGKNVFGSSVLRGHGRPGPIVLVDPGLFDRYVDQLDDAGKRALYDLFQSQDEERIEHEINRIIEHFTDRPDGA